MAFLRKKNCARTTIDQVGGLNSSDLSVVVTDASQLPDSGDFLVTVWNKSSFPNPCDDSNVEILKVTDISGNILTIQRGQEDTLGVSHANNHAVEMLITAGTFEELETEINSLAPGQNVFNEELTSQIDGITDTFTTANNYISGTLRVYVNGARRSPGIGKDFVEVSANTFQLNFIPTSEQTIIIDYIKS